MKNYDIKKNKKDFFFLNTIYNVKGSRKKRIVSDYNKNFAMFKYEREDYICSEACSEKISYEIAKYLGYECARIELAEDENGNLGVLNYLFSDKDINPHTDIVSYLNKNSNERAQFYTISNIKKVLDELDSNLFKDFIKIMVFDALIGEQDRHEENWGITKENGKYKISPLYDNGCSLLREFKNEEYAAKFYNKIKDFDVFINKSQCIIYKENSNKNYKHFELINYLNNLYPEYVKPEIERLNRLTDNVIKVLVNRIPDKLLTKTHKEHIIIYLMKRRDILLNIN